MGFHIGVARLTVNTEAPSVQVSLVRKCCSVTETSRACLDLYDLASLFIGRETYMLWQFHNLSFTNA